MGIFLDQHILHTGTVVKSLQDNENVIKHQSYVEDFFLQIMFQSRCISTKNFIP